MARTRRVVPALSRVTLGALVAIGSAAGCRDCDGLGDLTPNGSIDPPLFDFGPIVTGQACVAELHVVNDGRVDLTVSGAVLEATDGNFSVVSVPTLVRLGGSEALTVDYTAGDAIGERESTVVSVSTDDPDADGIITGSITALVTDAAKPIALGSCADPEDDTLVVTPCPQLSFGPVNAGDAAEPIFNRIGRTLSVTITNDGNADLNITDAALLGANPDFAILGIYRGTTLAEERPVVVPPGRTADCGQPSGANNTVTVDVKFAPTAIGGDENTLRITTDGAEGAQIDVPLSGSGSRTALLLSPDRVSFGAVTEGDSGEADVVVQNAGTSEARVDQSCIDLEGDGTCEARCTGAPADTALFGTLSCDAFRADGTDEGQGFVLGPTGAEDDSDKVTVRVFWAPVAGHTQIPATAVLALQSNILNNLVYEAPISGGAQGFLTVASAGNACGGGFCVTASGDPADTTTWTGSITFTLGNTGDATLTFGDITLDGAPTIIDDYTPGAPSASSLAVDATATLRLDYHNGDFSTVDPMNLIIHHDGVGGETLIPIDIIPPQ